MRTRAYSVGEVVGGAEVEALLSDPAQATTQADMRYLVRYLCCGGTCEINHRRLADRERRMNNRDRYARPYDRCELCAPSQRNRQVGSRQDISGMFDLRGQWWPFLRGPMGHRHGVTCAHKGLPIGKDQHAQPE